MSLTAHGHVAGDEHMAAVLQIFPLSVLPMLFQEFNICTVAGTDPAWHA